MSKMKLVLIGNGMAGVRTLEELLKLSPDLCDITVFGAEAFGNYNRILLSPVLSGEMAFQDILLNDRDWYEANNITLHLGKKVVRVDRRNRVVHADDGTQASYDRLLLATGAVPIVADVPGQDLAGVIAYRDIDDTNAMLEASAVHRHAVVIGGGLLGLEAANGLKQRGMEVTVIHLAPSIMNRQLDATAAKLLQRSLEAKGLSFLLEAQTERLIGRDGRVCAVRCVDGREVSADLVVMAIGIRPNIELAKSSGLHCNSGIVVNDTMQTFDPRIYAVGECVEHRGVCYGLVAPLFEMAKVCANHLARFGTSSYAGSVTSTKLKVTGVDVFSAGDFAEGSDREEITFHDAGRGIYKKVVLSENRIVGSVLYGDTADAARYFQMLKERRNVSDVRDHLLLGTPQLGCAGHEGQNIAANLPDDTEICGCNGVTKGSIVKAVTEHGLFTLAEVRKHTKASGSCGSCTGLVEQILASVLGGAYTPVTQQSQPLCGCTDYTHEDVRRTIKEQHLVSVLGAMEFMEWRTPDGCPTCRPAINYYVCASWPHEARDESRSRLVNERVHANIQKDGTYSVVPRMYGGVTTPEQLRRLAEVAEKYRVPLVKVTGGQRIDLLGVKKEDLPQVWKDLDMPSGYAYGKALRTVKTCVGSSYCRFGTQDSMAMGIELERIFEGVWAPAKLKMAVSGCPRNCAESTVKDVGVIGVDSGWEIHIAGNGGIKAAASQFFVKVRTPEEVIEHIGALLQLYREEARYGDRTLPWVESVGMDYVRQRVVDDEAGRRNLHGRILDSLRGRRDPWTELQGEAGRHEFAVLSTPCQ